MKLSDKIKKSCLEDDAFLWVSDVKEHLSDYIKYTRIDGNKDKVYAFKTMDYLKDKYGEYPQSDEHAIELIFGYKEK